jgi:hypothetical protein
MSDDLKNLIEESATEVSRILATNSTAVVQALVDKAVGGCTNSAALLLKHCISAKTKIKLDIQPGSTLEEFADGIVGQAVSGSLAIEDAEAFLRLAERASTVNLSATVVARLQSLSTALDEAKAAKLLSVDVSLRTKPLDLIDFVQKSEVVIDAT